jgi:predicted component of type VI protein secretion system
MTPWWSSLVGVVIGGLLSWCGAYFVERKRRIHSREDKLHEARREAIVAASAWLDPMYSALMLAESETFVLLNPGDEDEKEQRFLQSYPNLLNTLVRLDLPPHKRSDLLLPENTYLAGQRIRKALEDLKYQAIDLWGQTLYPIHAPAISRSDARVKCSESALIIKAQIDSLRASLEQAYRATYE